jgi:KTSC domain-containing protein
MPEVHSSAITRIYYSARRRELFVSFRSGRIYVYFDVSREEYDRFLASPSQGQYFNFQIRNRYRYRELTKNAAPAHHAA